MTQDAAWKKGGPYESGTVLESQLPKLLSILTYLALGQLRLDRRPSFTLGSIT